MSKVIFLNPRTCGIYKDGRARYLTDHASGERTSDVDNELIEHVELYLAGRTPPGCAKELIEDVFDKQILVPTYFDRRLNKGIETVCTKHGLRQITLGELIDSEVLKMRGGHGSPSKANGRKYFTFREDLSA